MLCYSNLTFEAMYKQCSLVLCGLFFADDIMNEIEVHGNDELTIAFSGLFFSQSMHTPTTYSHCGYAKSKSLIQFVVGLPSSAQNKYLAIHCDAI